ncbi:MAG: 2-dehydro-3-deoxyphosphogluconate aldolase [Bacilli bacterium]|jgi:2-dehydro-3-deoxyphosphogluconate aldolase/(4S)-4-hydroxy-2-oxoglutarate aldolase|nr:2-dehydro-3-deoxyphosphogluconate aldolase [Bacilli bacterium]
MNLEEILNKINDNYLMAIIRANTSEELLMIVDEVVAGGIKSIEITYSNFDVSEVLNKINNKYNDKILLGAGTVLDKDTALKAINSGAKYIVAPNFEKEVALVCNEKQVPYLAGCATASEVANALKNKANIIKAFPAHLLKESFIKDMKGPFPKVKIMPSGGINLENALLWKQAGAFAIGIGSDLYKDKNKIKEKTKEYVKLLK